MAADQLFGFFEGGIREPQAPAQFNMEEVIHLLKSYDMLDLLAKKHRVFFFLFRGVFFSYIVSFKRKKKDHIHVDFAKTQHTFS